MTIRHEAFEVLHFVAAKRLALGKLTVVDATNVQSEARAPLVALARRFHSLPVAIVLNLPEAICQERNRGRADRSFGPHVIRNQRTQLRRSLRALKRKGSGTSSSSRHRRRSPWRRWNASRSGNDRSGKHGPFGIIGDIHGCADELELLLQKLGYTPTAYAPGLPALEAGPFYSHPDGRKAVFVDRGPRVLDTLGIVINMVCAGTAMCVSGNHDAKLLPAPDSTAFSRLPQSAHSKRIQFSITPLMKGTESGQEGISGREAVVIPLPDPKSA